MTMFERTFRRIMSKACRLRVGAADFSALHVELSPYAGIGLALAQFEDGTTEHKSVEPALEFGVRLASYLTWSDALQLGIEGQYGLVVGRQAITDQGAVLFVNQGFSIALGIGMRIH